MQNKFIPKVGQLLFRISKNPPQSAGIWGTLFYIDSPIEEDQQWMHTEVATNAYEDGKEVYTGIECGGMGPYSDDQISDNGIRVATDEDIEKMIRLKLETEDEKGVGNIANWINGIDTEQDLESLLDSEKDRIKEIVNKLILELKGEKGIKEYQDLLGQPYKPEG